MKFTKEMNESEVIERKHIYKTTHIQIKLNDKMDGWSKRERKEENNVIMKVKAM